MSFGLIVAALTVLLLAGGSSPRSGERVAAPLEIPALTMEDQVTEKRANWIDFDPLVRIW